MTIETKFNVGDRVITIENNSIKELPVEEIHICITTYTKIRYVLLKGKAVNFGDKDSTVTKDEDECFKSIEEIYEHYQKKLKNRK